MECQNSDINYKKRYFPGNSTMASSNSGSRKGPTISRNMLKGKKVKGND